MHDPQSAPPDAPQWRTDDQVPVQPPAPPFAAESPTEPFSPRFAAPPAAPAPAWGRPMFAPPEPAAPAPKAPTARRSSGVGLVVTAILATAVLTSGGTYLAMSATLPSVISVE